jgi:hypothetical protein
MCCTQRNHTIKFAFIEKKRPAASPTVNLFKAKIVQACGNSGIWFCSAPNLSRLPRQKFGLAKFCLACKILPGWLGKNNNSGYPQNMGTYTHKTPIYTHEQIVSVYHPYYIRLMIKCDIFYIKCQCYCFRQPPIQNFTRHVCPSWLGGRHLTAYCL